MRSVLAMRGCVICNTLFQCRLTSLRRCCNVQCSIKNRYLNARKNYQEHKAERWQTIKAWRERNPAYKEKQRIYAKNWYDRTYQIKTLFCVICTWPFHPNGIQETCSPYCKLVLRAVKKANIPPYKETEEYAEMIKANTSKRKRKY